MTATADVDTRRRQVAEALLEVVAEQGLAGAKLVTVAERAGISVGLVQHHFRSKSQLLRFAVEHLCRRAEERIDEIRAVRPLRVALYRLAESLLPLDDERRNEAAVWASFLPLTLTDGDLAALHRGAVDHQLTGFERVVAAAQTLDELPDHLDAALEARQLTAFLDGLANYMLTCPDVYDAAASRHMLQTYLDRLFTDGGDRSAGPREER
ncbi:TetR family transcriptional regulator C-terminal domain-containing protein [Nonomuraea sp. NPDC050643]|uniref:TetR/AcrR family transcriptional regulator n=1 Tax=Nonomuraea sp. NPDC050643 TaxID=3155660 RepID=UPI0033C32F24